jgi:protease I
MKLQEATVAVLCENQYQELELWYPLLRLREERAAVYTVGPKAGAMYTSKLGYPVTCDLAAGDIAAADFDAVIIPGGHSPENMRRSADIIDFVRKMDERGAIVAAICHAGWVLASAGIAKGRRLTCVGVIKDDVIHAGGEYVNEKVVRDGNLITSRLPSDLPAFTAAVIGALSEVAVAARRPDRVLPDSSSFPSYFTRAHLVPLSVGVASPDYAQISAPIES